MAVEGGLRRRLALMLVATAVGVSLLLPFTFWLADTQLEGVAREDLLTSRLIELIRNHSAPFDVDTGRSTLAYYRPAQNAVPALPPEFARLAPGSYRELPAGGRTYSVHVRDAGPGDRAYLSYEIGFIEHLEISLWMFVMALAVLIGLAVWVFARSMVNRALSPFSDLVAQIRALTPGGRGQRLDLNHPDRELAIIIESFNSYLAELDMLVERERSFAAAASHELRTPLTVIQGASRLIDEMPNPPERVRQRLRRAAEELAQDLDALLLLSQGGAEAPAEPLWLDRWLPELAERHIEATHSAATVKWIVPRPVHLAVPPGAVNVVFSNLLRNALRAAGSGEVVIEIHEDRVVVLDSGPGIPADELPLVFEPRFRGHDGGSGMGLYIASTLAARYDWSIELGNRPEGGACALWRLHPETA